ncbi:MAG: DUF2834 domain-containing protein [Deltaproteobacteria bacterium]|nr:DUF2834 domain-containing protein [Deltaproteobacteria bacterium]
MSAERRTLGLAGLLLLTWFGVGGFLWLAQGGGVRAAVLHFLEAVRSDWMVVLFVNDLLVLLLLASVWVWADGRRRRVPAGRRGLWVAAVLLLGSPALLLYLAFRPEEGDAT